MATTIIPTHTFSVQSGKSMDVHWRIWSLLLLNIQYYVCKLSMNFFCTLHHFWVRWFTTLVKDPRHAGGLIVAISTAWRVR